MDKIRDSAGQKGTGKWTAISALEYGVPVTLIGESVFSRCLSSLLEERQEASKYLKGPSDATFQGDKKQFLKDIEQVRIFRSVFFVFPTPRKVLSIYKIEFGRNNFQFFG